MLLQCCSHACAGPGTPLIWTLTLSIELELLAWSPTSLISMDLSGHRGSWLNLATVTRLIRALQGWVLAQIVNTDISGTITNFCLYLVSCWAVYPQFETAAGAFWQYGWADQWSGEVSLPSCSLFLDKCSHFSVCQLSSKLTNKDLEKNNSVRSGSYISFIRGPVSTKDGAKEVVLPGRYQ